MSSSLVVVVVVAWVVVGLLSGLWMTRRGFDPLWILVALPLGPLFVPIAMERVQRRPGLAAFGPKGAPPQRSDAVAGPRVLVGLDGSTESQRALSTVLRLFGSHFGLLVLAEVVHFEATEDVTGADVDAASRRLAAAAADADIPSVHTEVLAGPAGPTLRQFAQQQDMDIVVVGRRGRGVSARVLGSVSADLVQNCPVPVLVVEPVSDMDRASQPEAEGEQSTAVTHQRQS